MRNESRKVHVQLRRLWWVGPLTVAVAVVAVVLIHLAAVAVLDSVPPFLNRLSEPIGFTAVLVSLAVVVFAIVGDSASNPVRTYRRTALTALLISLLPDLALGVRWLFRGEGWTLAIVFMLMHVVAWAAAVETLTRVATSRPSETP